MWARLGTGPAPDQLAFRLSAQDVTTTVLRVPIAAAYPPSRWEDREMLQGRYRIRVPAALADGTYQLSALPSGSSAAIDLGRITVRGGQRRYETQRSDYPVAADFASGLRLRGVDVAPERPQAGLPLTLTLQWQALRGGLDDGTVFVHVYDQEGRLVAQHDGVPAAGERPLPGWLPGEVVMDSHVIRLPAELANGSYRLAVGVYDPASGRRWPCESVGLPTAADAVSLPVELYRGPGGLVIQGSYEDDQVP
jgi:hypothetical protein